MTDAILAPKSGPRLYICPPLCRLHDSQRHLSQSSTLVHDRSPVAGTKSVTTIPDRSADQFPVSQVRQCSNEWSVNQPTSEIRSEPVISVVAILVHQPECVLN